MRDFVTQLNTFAEPWLETMLRASWQGGLVLLLAVAFCRWARGLSPAVRCWVLRVAYLKLLVAICWFAPIELRVLPAPNVSPASAAVALESVVSAEQSLLPRAQAEPDSTRPDVATWLWLFWLAGALYYGAMIVRDLRKVRTLRCGCRPVQDPWVMHCAAELSQQLRLRKSPKLLTSPGISSPIVFGVVRPAIVLPAAMLESSRGPALRLAIAHELGHVKRHDLLWSWLLIAGETLFFFHPVVWLARRESRLIQEIACDRMAIKTSGAETADYSRMLLAVVAQLDPRPNLPPPRLTTAAIFETRHTLERRIKAMNFKTRRSLTIATSILLLLLAPAGILPWSVVAQKPVEPKIDTPVPLHPYPLPGPGRGIDNTAADSEEAALLEHEIALAKEELEFEQKKLESGRTTPLAVLEGQRALVSLQEELARLKRDPAREEEVLREAITATKDLVKQMQRRVQVGNLPPGEETAFKREVLRLERKLQGLKRQVPFQTKATPPPPKRKPTDATVEANVPVAKPDPTPGTDSDTAAPPRPIKLSAPAPGIVIEIPVKPNDKVKAGQVLLRFDDREAKLRLQAAEAQMAIAETSLRETGRRVAVSGEQYLLEKPKAELQIAKVQVELARLALESLTLRAPRDGMIIGISTSEGEYVKPGPLIVIQ